MKRYYGMKRFFAFLSICIFLVLSLLSCNGNNLANHNKSDDTYDVEYNSLKFNSTEQLRQAIEKYPSFIDANDIQSYRYNKFDEIKTDPYPELPQFVRTTHKEATNGIIFSYQTTD